MKQTTIDALLIARTLIERATDLSRSDDRHLASAGLVLIQDSLEMAFYAILIEKSVDETKTLEGKSFDELIGELKMAGVTVPKSGTLKALNKQRVLTKHYAQVAEPITVRNYLEAALSALDAIVQSVIGRPLRDLFFTDFLKDGEIKECLRSAEKSIAGNLFFDALVEVRKAFFLSFEQPYSIHEWADSDGTEEPMSLAYFSRGGFKAHYWKRNKKWIDDNVKEPTDYVQVNDEQWRVDALECGIHTAELSNIRRLTPPVFRANSKSTWAVKTNLSALEHISTESNAKYCLDRTVAAILKKQEHSASHRHGSWYAPLEAPESYVGSPVYKKASTQSEVVHVVNETYTYTISETVNGFDGDERFVRLSGESKIRDEDRMSTNWISGYLQVEKP